MVTGKDSASKLFFPENGPNLCLVGVTEKSQKVKNVDFNSCIKFHSDNGKLAFYFVVNKEQ